MKRISTLIFAFIILATQHVFAVPANPAPATFIQSDGSEVTVHLRGDEFFSWHETVDGYTLLRQDNGDFVFATLDPNFELVSTQVLATNPNNRAPKHVELLQKTGRHAVSLSENMQRGLENRRMRNELFEQRSARRSPVVPASQQAPQIGRQMVVLVEFQDVRFRDSYTGTSLYGKRLFDSIMNAENHTINGAMGSVRQYFLDVSNGLFDAQSTVFGPVLLPENRAFYGGNDPSGWDLRPETMVMEALQMLASQVDFTPFINPTTGIVDGVHVIFAGCGEENLACPANAVWSHQGHIGTTPMAIGNATFHVYSVSPELAGGATSTTPTHIGVIAHEMGHSLLGWPDSYSVNVGSGTGGCVDFGNWCIMANGVWNYDGRRPAKPSAWFVVDAGWVEERVLDTPQDIVMPDPAQNRVIYRINTQTTNEYFLLDNRQQIGWDLFVPSSGLLISHVDRTPAALPFWAANQILSHCSSRHLYIKQAGCGVANGCSGNRGNDVWGRTGFTEFTDHTTPNARSWAGEPTNKPVTGITLNTAERTVSFRFMYEPSIDEPATVPYFEGFENSASEMWGYLPEGWTQYVQHQTITDNAWFPFAGFAFEPGGTEFRPRTGNRQMIRIWEDAGDFAWAFSEPIQLSAEITYTVSFWYLAPGYEHYYDLFKVQIGPSRELVGTGANAQMIGATTLLKHGNQSTSNWTEVSIEFTPTVSGPHYIGFHCMTEWGEGLIITIDDISITKPEDTLVPIFEITLSQTEMHTFDTLVFGYDTSDLTPLLVTITNTGNQPTGELHIYFVKPLPVPPPNVGFRLSNTTISNIAVGEYSTLTVVPILGLDIGTHTEKIVVSGNSISENFTVRFTVIEDTATNIANIVNAAPLQVFPNPVTDNLYIVIPSDIVIPSYTTVIPSNARDLIVEIFDVNGRRVFTHPICHLSLVTCHFIVDISHLPNGTYIVRIGNRSTVIVKQ